MTQGFTDRLAKAEKSVRSITSHTPRVGLILGSGLSSVAERLGGDAIAYEKIEGFPTPTVAGHRGVLFTSDLFAVMAGRFHFYEGHSMDSLVLPVFLMHRLGVRTLFVTNASGGINEHYQPGDIVLIKDHINLQGTNPLIGPNPEGFGPRFPDMTQAYTPELRDLVHRHVNESLAEGVYAALTGPTYETPAEIRMLRAIGADMVGMSTVPEVIAASYLGMQVLGISCITNLAAGLGAGKLDHQEVVDTGKRVEAKLTDLVLTVLDHLKG